MPPSSCGMLSSGGIPPTPNCPPCMGMAFIMPGIQIQVSINQLPVTDPILWTLINYV